MGIQNQIPEKVNEFNCNTFFRQCPEVTKNLKRKLKKDKVKIKLDVFIKIY